jgi:hypothetical protein
MKSSQIDNPLVSLLKVKEEKPEMVIKEIKFDRPKIPGIPKIP